MRSARRAREGGFAISGVRAGERERLGKTDVWGTAAGRGAASEKQSAGGRQQQRQRHHEAGAGVAGDGGRLAGGRQRT